MKPYIIVRGEDINIDDFENKIAFAMEQGYEISGDLITHVINDGNQDIIILLQPMYLTDESYKDDNI